jgi:predicted MFS family arabinose efflux permease
VSDAARGVIVLSIIPAAGAGGLPAAFAMVFLLYLANTFFLPARSAILPDLVPADRLVEANSLATLAGVIATIAGSLAGGMLVERLGWRVGFAIDAGTYFISVVALWFLRVEPRPRAPRAKDARAAYAELMRDVREGARIAVGSRAVLGSIGAMALLWIAGGALHVAAPTLIERRGSGMISGMGDFLAAAAVGMVAGTLLLAARGRAASSRGRIVVALLGTGLALAAFAWVPLRLAPLVAAAAAGVFVAMLLVTTEAMIQESVAEAARARVFALRDFLARVGVLASAGFFGLALKWGWITPVASIGAAGGLLVLGSLVIPGRREA